MAASVHCRIASARVRDDRAETLAGLIRQLFHRRHLSYVAPSDRAWLTAELVQSLRRKSEVYRAMSAATSGPLPFALGYFRLNDRYLEPVSDTVPVDDPERLVRLLSEFLRPGARLYFGTGQDVEGWCVHDVGVIERIAREGPSMGEGTGNLHRNGG